MHRDAKGPQVHWLRMKFTAWTFNNDDDVDHHHHQRISERRSRVHTSAAKQEGTSQDSV
jgi:uncharacterized protein YdaU (DUF1376 family)